jgi:DNA-directed RNA polymerase specialized sigma24 family protein
VTCRKQNPELEDKGALYASSEDFRRLFADQVDRLYQLAFLLTGDHDTAERCFVAGVEDSVHGNNVFKEWAHSWAKRTIIRLAVRALQPQPGDSGSAERGGTHSGLRSIPDSHDLVARLLSLDDFDRFVFVMSVLERDSEHECALLLGCTPSDVREARRRSLQQLTEERPPRTNENLSVDEIASGAGGSQHG